MTNPVQPVYFSQAQYDSKTSNLVLLNAEGGLAYAADIQNRDELVSLLGESIANKLLATPSAVAPEGTFTLEQDGQMWNVSPGEIVSQLADRGTAVGSFVAHAYCDPSNEQVHVDVQTRDAEQGDVAMAVCVASDSAGYPCVSVHNKHGHVVQVHLHSDGEVGVYPVATKGRNLESNDMRIALSRFLMQPGIAYEDKLNMLCVALEQAPAGVLSPIVAALDHVYVADTQSTVNAAGALVDDNGEVVVQVADGWTIRSAGSEGNGGTNLVSGDYVRVCRPDGSEYMYWDANEWRNEPEKVMGAILNAAAGYRPVDGRPNPTTDPDRAPDVCMTA
jgi:hypothetical protein